MYVYVSVCVYVSACVCGIILRVHVCALLSLITGNIFV